MSENFESQKRLYGWALSYKIGECEDCPEHIKKLADSLSKEELEKFSSKVHDKTEFPQHVIEATLECLENMDDASIEKVFESKSDGIPGGSIDAPPVADTTPSPPPGVDKTKPGKYPEVFRPSLFKMPMNKERVHDRRIMDFKEFLKRLNYRTHDDTLQAGHGQNLTGKGGAAS